MKRFLLLAVTVTGFIMSAATMAQAQADLNNFTYSSNFKIGNAAQATKILELWKDWDDNMLDRHDYFADTLIMIFSDGTVMKGKKENMEAAKKYRGGFSKVVSRVHACIPLTRIDKNEDVVCIWGTEVNTLPDGKEESRDLHEVWWFNKDGKISIMRQWSARFGE